MKFVRVNITIPKDVKKDLDEIVKKDNKKISNEIAGLIIRQYNLSKGAEGHAITLNNIQDLGLTLAHERVLTGDEYAKIFAITEEAKKRITKK
jgi:uncharacterized protein YacL